MTSFCPNCGAATGGGRFCPKCGSPQTDASAPQAAPSLSQLPYQPPPRKKSSALKIVLIVLALFFVLGIVALVRGYFFFKDVYQEAKQEAASGQLGTPEKTQAGCDLLDKDKASKILGTQIVATKGNEAGDITEYCSYLTAENVASGAADAEDALRKTPTSGDGLKDFGTIVKKINEARTNKPFVSVHVYRGNIGGALIGLKAATRLSGNGIAKIPGPWDEAFFGPQETVFVVRKGANGFVIDVTQVPTKHDAGINLAKEMVAAL